MSTINVQLLSIFQYPKDLTPWHATLSSDLASAEVAVHIQRYDLSPPGLGDPDLGGRARLAFYLLSPAPSTAVPP